MKMWRSRLVVIVFPLALILAACGNEVPVTDNSPVDPEAVFDLSTPQGTLARMLELAKAGDWDAYVNDFYGEQHKFLDQHDREKVVRRFRQRWGASIVEQLSMLTDISPELLDEGKRASFQLPDENPFFLYKDDAGKWTFHL